MHSFDPFIVLCQKKIFDVRPIKGQDTAIFIQNYLITKQFKVSLMLIFPDFELDGGGIQDSANRYCSHLRIC
jgi:hypothetical protein